MRCSCTAKKPVGKWVDPYVVADKRDKIILLDTGERVITASIDKVKLYRVREAPHNVEQADEAEPRQVQAIHEEELLPRQKENGEAPETTQITDERLQQLDIDR